LAELALVHAPLAKQADWQVSRQETAWVAILDDADEKNSLTAISAGASAILCEDMPMSDGCWSLELWRSSAMPDGTAPSDRVANDLTNDLTGPAALERPLRR
jgi:hypothetical protein